MKTVKISSFLKERKIKLKPQAANCSGLQRIEKIDFSGKIYLSPVQTNTDMILVKSGDLVISGINVEKGALAIYTGEEDVLASIHYSAYEFDAEKIDIDYLKWFLKRNIFRKLLLKQTGSGIKKEIKAKHLLPIEIHLPSLNRQHEIVRQIQGVADYIEEVNQQIQQQAKYAEMLRQSILQQAVEGKLCEQDPNDEPASVLLEKIKAEKERLIAEKKIKKQKPLPPISEEEKTFDLPKGWEWCRLGELVTSVTDGPHYSPEYHDKGIPFISGRNITLKGIDFSTAKFISPQLHEELSKRCRPETGDILYTKGGETGKAVVNDIDFEFNVWVHVAVLKPSTFVYNKYLALALNSPHCYALSQKYTHGTGNRDLGLTRMIKITVPLPPANEQQRIVQRVTKLMGQCNLLERELSISKKYASQLMESVLQEAFSVQETAKPAQVIEFHPDQTIPETELLAAARGKIREDTWEHLCKRALEIAGEEG